MVQWVKNLTAAAWVAAEAWILALCSGLKDPEEVTASVQIQSLAWELPYAVGTARERKSKGGGEREREILLDCLGGPKAGESQKEKRGVGERDDAQAG